MQTADIQDIFISLVAAGYNPLLCDTQVPVSSCAALCGPPAEIGDDDKSEFLTIPKSFGSEIDYILPVEGDSMVDAGIEPGDQLHVRSGAVAKDGDIVLALIDGCATVKSFCRDDDGMAWLVPQNKNYEPILLNNAVNVKLLGVVTKIIKNAPRVSVRSMMKVLKAYKLKQRIALCDSPEDLSQNGEQPMRDIFLENRTRSITKEISRSRVASVFASGHSKKEILESLYPFQSKYIDLLSLSEEDRVEWLNAQASHFQGSFKTTDLKYFHDIEEEPNRRSRPPKAV